jgi:integrase
VTTQAITQQLQRWMDEGYAASTVNGWRTALMAMFTDLDGPGVLNPVRGSIVFEEPALTARGIPYAYVLKILDAIPDRRVYSTKADAKVRLLKTRPRIGLMATTGMRPSQIGRIEKGVHFNVDERWYVIPRSAKGSQRRRPRTPRPLTRKFMTELQADFFAAFDARDCYSQPDENRHLKAGIRRAFRVATRAAEQEIRRELRDPTFRFPPDLKPYDLRHSFATALLERTGGNFDLVAEHLDQADTRHVRRYGLAAISSLNKQAALAFEAGIKGVPRTPPQTIMTPMPRRRPRRRKTSPGHKERRA